MRGPGRVRLMLVQAPIGLGRDPRLSTRTRIITKFANLLIYMATPPPERLVLIYSSNSLTFYIYLLKLSIVIFFSYDF